MAKSSLVSARAADIQRAATSHDAPELINGCLARITGATVITSASSVYRWLYTWTEATIGAAPSYTPAVKSGGIAGNAVSVSETGNTLTTVAYGILISHLPVGFLPVRIPNDTAVWVVPNRCSDGTLLWVIINTQAIDGTCPNG